MERKFKVGICAGIILLIVAIGSWYHFNVNSKTPESTLRMVEESIHEHNKENFYKFVDLEGILETSYEGIIDGMTYNSNKIMTEELRESVKDFTEMLKSPMLLSLQAAIDSYIETGNFHEEDNVGVAELLQRTGLNRAEFRGVGNIIVNPNDDNVAEADIQLYHPEIGREFTLKFILKREESGDWKITHVENFHEFIKQINKVRRKKLDDYLNKSAEINLKHDKLLRNAEEKSKAISAAGSLAQEVTRTKLKAIMLDEIKKDWENRKAEFSELTVPKDAETLQNLRLKICDLEISYAENYAKWLDDKQAATIKSAEEKHHQAKTLKLEEQALVRRMTD